MTSLRSWRHPPIPIIRKSYVICASLCNLGLDTSAVTGAKSCTLAMNPWSVLQSPSCSNFLQMRNPDFISHKLPTAFSPARSSVSLNILAFESARVNNTWLPVANTTGYLIRTRYDPDTTSDMSDMWHFKTKSHTKVYHNSHIAMNQCNPTPEVQMSQDWDPP